MLRRIHLITRRSHCQFRDWIELSHFRWSGFRFATNLVASAASVHQSQGPIEPAAKGYVSKLDRANARAWRPKSVGLQVCFVRWRDRRQAENDRTETKRSQARLIQTEMGFRPSLTNDKTKKRLRRTTARQWLVDGASQHPQLRRATWAFAECAQPRLLVGDKNSEQNERKLRELA